MGVPALFRWLSRKYPKIIYPVVEEEEKMVQDEDGLDVTVPIDTSGPNPNGTEFDNLYLDMNGIVHPCTHPEGKPAPETEEDMMLEIFSYTERVVSMVRPRKLLMMAIDGVAPRAKMNQQRSRRFRSAQEAKEKEEARKESLAIWESMGKTITDDMRDKEAWDSNAITPGTPFMDLLAQSLRYWVVQKMNTDPGWKQLEVIISDASVPGEGEHKIVDFIRRQRTNLGYDPCTRHVIYGLDADLIMLSLATHEPYFRVLREDVFFQDTSPNACRICGQEGHYAAQCKGEKKVKADEHDTKSNPVTKKPFIFLDVSVLREYLEFELNVSNTPFPFDFERAIDDWVLLIFFVGNDFLPHLPSLEIREGAIDTLLKIWKDELPRMGGYLTNHGHLEYARAEIILEGLARREDEIFRRRREAEERQDQNAKRRKLEASGSSLATASINEENIVAVKPSAKVFPDKPPPQVSMVHSLPPRPNFDSFESSASSMGFGSSAPPAASANASTTFTDTEWVVNRRAIRMANLSAAEMLKLEMMTAKPVSRPGPARKITLLKAEAMNPDAFATTSPVVAQPDPVSTNEAARNEAAVTSGPLIIKTTSVQPELSKAQLQEPVVNPVDAMTPSEDVAVDHDESRGVKRKAEEDEDEDEDAPYEVDEDDTTANTSVAVTRKVNPDGTVEQEDTVKLWEPGYRERYYRQKFGVELSDTEFRKNIIKSYVEGMAWVLRYYYQGTPSWTWFYPYHFAPFAADFVDVAKMDIKFDLGQPFKPFEQLMGVFPASSRKHIPATFHSLMTDTDSPIIDFYPETFEIDMNGKKMAWQGVALLPFIEEKRLLDAMADKYSGLTEEEVQRNKWGTNVLFVFYEHPLYVAMEGLYGKRKNDEPIPIDPKQSKGMNGSLLPDPSCIPGSTYYSPLSSVGLFDIENDQSLSAQYFYPRQLKPHRSVLLPGVRRPARVLTQADYETVLRGGRGRGRGNGSYNGRDSGRNSPYGSSQQQRGGTYSNGYWSDRTPSRGRGSSDYGRQSYSAPHRSYQPPHINEYGRSGNGYYPGTNNGYQGSNSYNRESPSYYGGQGNGYSSSSQPSYFQNFNNSGGYGSSARGGYSSHANERGSRETYGGHGGYGANNGGSIRGYDQPTQGGGYGGYGGFGVPTTRGGAPSPSGGRGRGRY